MKFENIPTWPEWKKASSSFLQTRADKPKLVRIDDLVKKYHQVLDMSKLNILMELKDAIVNWAADKIDRDVGTGRLEAMQALEQVVLRKLYELDGLGKHRYLQVVCMGYEIKTGAYDPSRKPANDKQRQKDETVEIGGRVTELITAIRKAQKTYQDYTLSKNITADEDSRILKIFMAPEFYFRGPYGAYRDIGWLAKILSMIRSETGKVLYKDWLFVHGSALFSTEKTTGGKSEGFLLENFALVQKGGPKTSEHHDFTVEKEFPSHVDFKHPGLGNTDWYDPSKASAKIAGNVAPAVMPEGGRKDPVKKPLGAADPSVSELAGGTVFTMDSITFGLEVCRDHYLGRLAHSAEAGRVLIQLVPSCGMDIEAKSVACVPGGIVFNVDGAVPHVHIKVHSTGASPPAEAVPFTTSGTGKIRVFESLAIPWPGMVRADVAQRLKVNQGVLSGIRPIPPPKPAHLVAAKK